MRFCPMGFFRIIGAYHTIVGGGNYPCHGGCESGARETPMPWGVYGWHGICERGFRSGLVRVGTGAPLLWGFPIG